MRQVLVDHSRRKQAKKRAGELVPLEQVVSSNQTGAASWSRSTPVCMTWKSRLAMLDTPLAAQ
jgi:hypothetical protein